MKILFKVEEFQSNGTCGSYLVVDFSKRGAIIDRSSWNYSYGQGGKGRKAYVNGQWLPTGEQKRSPEFSVDFAFFWLPKERWLAPSATVVKEVFDLLTTLQREERELLTKHPGAYHLRDMLRDKAEQRIKALLR